MAAALQQGYLATVLRFAGLLICRLRLRRAEVAATAATEAVAARAQATARRAGRLEKERAAAAARRLETSMAVDGRSKRGRDIGAADGAVADTPAETDTASADHAATCALRHHPCPRR
jgi:pyruvate/2-oxoglutarate dehydrogenase complex dihydrolipoamide acyltransferase (E2) component